MSYIPEPVTRTDKYLAYIAGNMDVVLPDHPITRKEHYLAAWAEKSGFEDVDVTGEPPLTLENAIGKPLKGLRIYGKSKQVTTTGAQLLDQTKATVDGWNIKYDIPLEKSKTYTFTNGEKAANPVGLFGVNPGEKDELLSNEYLPPKGSYTFTCAKDYATILLGGLDGKTVFDGRYMLNAGSAPLPWEPYTGGLPSPSPDYPQEIESVGQRKTIGINVRGKNLLNYELLAKNEPHAYTVKNGEFLINLNNGIAWGDVPVYGTLKKGIYTIFGETIEINKAFENESIGYTSNPSNSKTFELTEDTTVKIKVGTGYSDYPRISHPMLVAGSAVTPYEPYHEPQFASIATPNGLPGIPVSSDGNYTDADGKQWICDEIDFGRGVYVRRVWKGVFDGSDDERWEIYNNTTYAGFYLTNVFAEKLTMRDGIANTYKVDNSYIPIEAVWIGVNEKAIYIKNSRFYDDTLSDKGLSNFKDSLAAHPMVIMTYLDSPIETPLTSDQLAAYKQFHTYKGTTIIDNDAGAYMSVRYEKMK